MSGGKHASDEGFEFELDGEKIKNIAIIVGILVIIVGVIFGTIKLINKMTNTKTEETSSADVEEPKTEKYPVLGKIVIDKIEVEQPILETVEEDALAQGVIKLYGDDLNQEGNFCIAGHNYDNIFKRLNELEVGDEIEIVDVDEQSTKYKVTQTASIEPTDLELLRKEAGKVQITLITCEDASTKRFVVKAEIQK